ncbi:MAG: FtsX-like permease family protein [Candidatus Eisenbacteria bacterium]|nr:FtsX-like permease family protein [Candidatus Eisenbacteria bacterium]
MEFGETLKSSFRTLWSHKLRSALTMLGIVIGTGALVAVMSLVAGLNAAVAAQFQSVGTDIVSVSKYPWVQMGDTEEYRNRADITEEDAEAVELLDSVGLVAPNIHTRRNVTHEGSNVRGTLITGTTPEYETIDNFSVREGRFITEFDVERRRSAAVLGTDVARELFEFTDPLEKKVRIGGHSFTVVGLLEEKGDILGSSLDDLVIVPFSTFEKLFGHRRSVVIDCQPAPGMPMDRTVEDIRQIMRIRRKVPRGEPDDFAVNTQDDLASFYRQITGALYMAMLGIVALSLLVGGIGVMNVMLVSVAERTREIGVRKAIGARRFDITSQFLVESIFLTCLGGIIGILGGSGIGLLVRRLTPLPAAVTPVAVALAVAFALVTGLLFGVYPASRAGRLNPIEALRYE